MVTISKKVRVYVHVYTWHTTLAPSSGDTAIKQ